MDLPMDTVYQSADTGGPFGRQAETEGVASREAGRRASQVLCRGPCLGRTGCLAEAYTGSPNHTTSEAGRPFRALS